MKKILPSLPRIPLMPRALVFVDAAGGVTGYRVRLRWNGRYRLQPAALPPLERAHQPCIAVIDRALPFRRKLQQMPASGKSRLAMLRTAPDEFPLNRDTLLYALGTSGSEGYLYALPRQALDTLKQRGLNPVIALVAGEGAGAEGSLDAFENYLRHGVSADLLRSGRILSRRGLLQIQLGALLALTLFAGGWLTARPDTFAGVIERRVVVLREQGSALPTLYRTTEKMAYAQGEAARIHTLPEAHLPAILAGLFATVPPGHSLRSIELLGGNLKIAGNGGEVQEWLAAQGFPPDRITVENLGQQKRFRAERPL